ncbi:MAG TPA: Maebl, partial [Rhodobacteraceae bacterium]|nr:Maebl [Paracoccaceae bacterium]
MPDPRAPLLAVLIDADNTSPRWTKAIFDEIASIGEASVRRVYGDFSSTQM